jgi:LiaI-LiaF-like transmembrane region/B-box zinc finger
MNCAIHTDVPAAAYCRTCGKALCQNCKRDVKGVIYCEDCIAARVHDTMPVAAPGQPVPPPPVLPVVVGAPSPGLAGVLAGFFPFGIGQVYNRQYLKGLVFMLTFAFLIWGTSSGTGLEPILGILIGFFYIYQIIDAVRTARAIQLGQPVPDPLGLETALGTREASLSKSAPVGAIVLIALGCLFLIHNFGFLHLQVGHWWPVVLIGLGVWMFTRRRTTGCPCVRCRCRAIVWPTFILTLGILWLLHTLDVKSFGDTWPLLLIMVGLAWVMQNNGPMTGHVDTTNGPAPPSDLQGDGEPRQEVSNV